MKIGGTPPVTGIAAARAERGQKQRGESARSSSAREISDTTSVMGIPEEELTPKVRAAIMTLMEEVERLRGEVNSTRARLGDLERVADQDLLLPVFNRRAFVRELSRVMSFSERYGTPTSVVYFDINRFKAINDSYGHAAGDGALELVAKTLVETVRESDIVGRLGGDEFGVILSHTDSRTAAEKAQILAQRVQNARFSWNGHDIELGVAYGVYSFKQGEDPAQALEAADKAMYAHKSSEAELG